MQTPLISNTSAQPPKRTNLPLLDSTTVAVAEVVFGTHLPSPAEALITSGGNRGFGNTHHVILPQTPTANIIVDKDSDEPLNFHLCGVVLLLLSVPGLLWLARCIALHYL